MSPFNGLPLRPLQDRTDFVAQPREDHRNARQERSARLLKHPRAGRSALSCRPPTRSSSASSTGSCRLRSSRRPASRPCSHSAARHRTCWPPGAPSCGDSPSRLGPSGRGRSPCPSGRHAVGGMVHCRRLNAWFRAGSFSDRRQRWSCLFQTSGTFVCRGVSAGQRPGQREWRIVPARTNPRGDPAVRRAGPVGFAKGSEKIDAPGYRLATPSQFHAA